MSGRLQEHVGEPMSTGSGRKYIPFGYKLMLSYWAFIMIPVILAGYAANSIFVTSVRDKISGNIQGTLRQMRDNISYKMEDTVRISDMLYFDSSLAENLRHYEEGWISYSTTTKSLLPKLHTVMEATNSRLWMSVYLHNNTMPEIYNDYRSTDPLTVKSRLFDLYHIDRIKDKAWYTAFPPEEYGVTLQWKQIDGDDRYGRISLLRRMVDTNNPLRLEEIGFLRISVRLSDIFESVDNRKISDETSLYIVDEAGRIVTSAGSARYQPGQLWEEPNREDHWVIREKLPGLNWTLAALVPADITEQDTNKVRTLTLVICLASIVIFSLLGMFISRYYAKRVGRIVSVLDSFQEGAFHKRAIFKGNDEFTRISSALNDMGQNIGNLIQEVYITNIQKKEAELESLQAQINPHFLYNTLSSISRLAKFGETEKLQRMVLDLAKFYRLSLNEGRTVIPIASELEQAKAYIDIQKTKYEERMQVVYQIDPHIGQYETLKLILQPFIENVLQHGWCGDRIHIRITGRQEGNTVVFQVIDDGIGMKPDLIRQIFDPVDNLNVGYGIRNVDQRIKLHYGREYGVSICSRPGMGTGVRIVIPVIQTGEEHGSL